MKRELNEAVKALNRVCFGKERNHTTLKWRWRKPQRNELCWCMSGKKFKHCCLNKPKRKLTMKQHVRLFFAELKMQFR